MPQDAFSRLLADDDLEQPADLPPWETHGIFYFMITTKGMAVLAMPPEEQGYGVVRFPDRSAVAIPRGSAKELFEKAENILQEGAPVWDRLDRDYLDPARVEKPKPLPLPEYLETEAAREPPRRMGQKQAFPWDFKK